MECVTSQNESGKNSLREIPAFMENRRFEDIDPAQVPDPRLLQAGQYFQSWPTDVAGSNITTKVLDGIG